MNCYAHPSRDAVGLCTHCGRGVCPVCATLVEDRVVCVGRCAAAMRGAETPEFTPQQLRRTLRKLVALALLGLAFFACFRYDVAHHVTGVPKVSFALAFGCWYGVMVVVVAYGKVWAERAGYLCQRRKK